MFVASSNRERTREETTWRIRLTETTPMLTRFEVMPDPLQTAIRTVSSLAETNQFRETPPLVESYRQYLQYQTHEIVLNLRMPMLITRTDKTSIRPYRREDRTRICSLSLLMGMNIATILITSTTIRPRTLYKPAWICLQLRT